MNFLFASCSNDSEPLPKHLPMITKLLIHKPKEHWAVFVTLMSLNQTDKLRVWLDKRLNIETTHSDPSFELLCVTLWLGDKNNLSKICDLEVLAQFLATKQDVDQFGNTVWHFARVGLGADFIDQAVANKHVLPLRNSFCQKVSFASKISAITTDRRLLESHLACYSGNPHTIDESLKNHTYAAGTMLFVELAHLGSWHSVLIGIVRGFYHIVEEESLALISYNNSHPKMQAMAEYWQQLLLAPRDKKVANKPLEELLEQSDLPEILFAYLVYQFTSKPEFAAKYFSRVETNRAALLESNESLSNLKIISSQQHAAYTNPKAFYGKMLNKFLKHEFREGAEPNLHVLELFIYSPKDLHDALDNETIVLARQATEKYYPNVVPHIFQAPVQDVQSDRNSILAQYVL